MLRAPSTTSDESHDALNAHSIPLQQRAWKPPASSTRKRWHRASLIFAAFKKFKSPAHVEVVTPPSSTEVLAAAVKGTSGLTPLSDMAQRGEDTRPFMERTFSARHVEMRSGANAFDFECAANATAQPYWQQGDAKWDAPELVQQRAQLLQSRRLVRACRQFWDASGLDEGATMTKAQYATIHRLITCALAPDMSEAQSAAALEDDWRDDLRGATEMSFERYLLSLYEIADLWTDSASELAYVVFINKLFRRITKPVRPAKDRAHGGGASGAASGAAFRAAEVLRKFKRPEEVVPMRPEEEDKEEEDDEREEGPQEDQGEG